MNSQLLVRRLLCSATLTFPENTSQLQGSHFHSEVAIFYLPSQTNGFSLVSGPGELPYVSECFQNAVVWIKLMVLGALEVFVGISC